MCINTIIKNTAVCAWWEERGAHCGFYLSLKLPTTPPHFRGTRKVEKTRVAMAINGAFCNSSYMGKLDMAYTVTQTSWLKEVTPFSIAVT